MRTLYTCNIGFENIKIEEFLLEKIKKGEEIIYILPTIDAIEKTKREYIDKLGGFFNLTFHTFDSIKKSITITKPVDEPFSLYIVSNILKNNNYKYLTPVTDGLIEKTMNFIKRAKEELIDPFALLNSKSFFLKELADVLIKYNEFLENYNLCDGLEYDLDYKRLRNKKFKNVIVNGFYTFREIDLLILKNLSENSNIIVNISYYFDNLKILQDTKKRILEFGFSEEKLYCDLSLNDLINKNRNKLNFISEENEFLEARAIYQELKCENINNNIAFENMAIILASKNNNILNLRDRENLDLNIKSIEVKNSPIISEFKNILDFFIEKSRENIIRRINSNYFKITENIEEIEYEILKMNFNNLDELIENTKEAVEINEENLEEFLNLVDKLKKKPMKNGGFKYYSQYFRKYLDYASDYVNEIYEIFNNDEYLKRDMNIISSINNILDRLEEFDIFFKDVDINIYINILKVYIDSITIDNRNYFATSQISLIESLCIKYDVSFLAGLVESYPNYKEGNFIFSQENKSILKELGMKSEDDLYIYENELIKIISLIENSKKVYLSTSSRESRSVFLDLLNENNDRNIRKNISTDFSDLFFGILKDGRNFNEEKVAHLKSLGEIKNLNKRIYPEQNRNNNEYAGIISNNARDLIRDILKNRNFSASDFDLYSESPFRFLFERLLNVEEMKRSYDDEYYMVLGSNYHKILEIYFKNYPNEYNEKFIEDISYNVFFEGKILNDKLNSLESLEYNQHLDIIKSFIKNDLDNRKGEIPSEFERKFEFNIENVNIVGRIDRIDFLNNSEILIDYKSASSPSKNKILNGESYQIPIYAMARYKNHNENIAEAKYGKIKDASYTSVLKNKDILGGKAKNDFTNEEFKDFLNLTERRILKIYDDMYNGIFFFKESKYNNILDLCRGDSVE